MNKELRKHIEETLDKGVRFDGRKPEEYREIVIETGVTRNAEGSARVKIGDTEVIVGIKMEMSKPYPDTPDKGTMMINVELLPLSSPEFEPGPPGILAVEIARVVDRGIRESEAIDVKKLCIEKGEKAWGVIIDVCPINDDGNLFDAASMGALAALNDCRIPGYDGIEIDYKNKTDQGLPLSAQPLEATVYKLGKHLFVDPTPDEEKVYDARLTVAFTEDGTVCAMQKGGTMPLSPADIDMMISAARRAVDHVRSKVKR